MDNLHSALLLTDSTPQEIKSGLWAKQATKDMLANKQDFAHPFKASSLICNFCGKPIDGFTNEDPDKKSKKKPWEVPVDRLFHEPLNPECALHAIRKKANGHVIEKLLICHTVTHAAALQYKGNKTDKETHPLQEDPSVPKLHTLWEEEERFEYESKLSGLKKDVTLEIGFDEEKTRNTVQLPDCDVQRIIPYFISNDTHNSWKDTLAQFPQWSDTHPLLETEKSPELESALTKIGWIITQTQAGPQVLCGYVLSQGDEEKGLTIEEQEALDGFHSPIYEILGPNSLFDKTETTPIPYIEVRILGGPIQEPLDWIPAVTIKSLKRKEKQQKLQNLNGILEKLPTEKIWDGFINPNLNGDPAIDRENEPKQSLRGYRPGSNVKEWWLPGIGNPHAKTWIIGLYPSNEEIKRKGGPKILSGASGIELFELVQNAGFDLTQDVYFENLIKRYTPPKSKLSVELKREQLWLLKKQLAYYKPERVIALGADVFKELAGGRKFQDARGTWMEVEYPKKTEGAWQGRLAGTFHPAGVLRPEGRHNLELFRHDMEELLLDKKQSEVEIKINELKTMEEVRTWVDREIQETQNRDVDAIYSLDTEGFSLDVHEDEPVLLQISRMYGTFDPQGKRLLFLDNTPEHEIPQDSTIFVFQENLPPEFFEKSAFIKNESLFDLFQDEPQPETPAVSNPPLITVANNEEERTQILRKHQTKCCTPETARDLYIFVPYKRKIHLLSQIEEVQKELKRLTLNKRCKGFVITNANFDRIRAEIFLDWDLTLPKKHGGLDYPLDTMLAEHLLDENGDLGLKSCLNKHFNWARQDTALENYKEKFHLDKLRSKITDTRRQSEWFLYPYELLKPYAAKDAYGSAALLRRQWELMDKQTLQYQKDRIAKENPHTLESAFHIQCGAITGTYEMNKQGMPVGQKGLKILDELTGFYSKHETRMIKEYQDAVFELTGIKNANPASPEELGYILFNEKSPLKKLGIEPWKESGNKGRLWSEISRDERHNCKASTDAESLEIIASNCPDKKIQEFLLKICDTKTIVTIRNNFITDKDSSKGLRGRINPHTLHMHTNYSPTLDTNRCRSNPNLSTFPKEEIDMVQKILGEAPPHKIREVIQAPPGTVLLNRDWSTAEVLGLGYLSLDENMLRIISKMNEGADFHTKLAIKTYVRIQEVFEKVLLTSTPPEPWLSHTFTEKKQEEIRKFWQEQWANGQPSPLPDYKIQKFAKKLFKQERGNIKPVTFGVPYGREAPAIQKQLNREYYVSDTRDSNGNLLNVTIEEAQAMIDSYKTEFHKGWSYLEDQGEQGRTNRFLRDNWGYVRHFPDGMKDADLTRKAYNYQIQHIVAVLMNQAMKDWVDSRQKYKFKSYSYATLYDNIGWVVYEDELQDIWDLSQEIMTYKRPVGPAIVDHPEHAILNTWKIPTEGDISYGWDGKSLNPKDLGINLNEELNLTGVENYFQKD
jgi:uracil-DNA glycosylase family 4